MTNKEVAELAGVSSAAVSRFLNGGYLSEEKRERIAAAIEQTGYVPSANARILRMKKSDTVGIVLTKSDDSTLTGVTAGLEKYLFAAGYGASLAYVGNEQNADFNAMRSMLERQIDGIVLISSAPVPGNLELFERARVPIVIVGQHARNRNCVRFDNFGAAYDLASALNCTVDSRVAYLDAGKRYRSFGTERRKGFLAGLERAGVPEDHITVVTGGFTVDEGYYATKKLLATRRDFHVISCATDAMAAGAIKAIHEVYGSSKRAKPPRVTGFGNDPILQAVAGPIPTVRFDYEECGIKAAEMMVDLLRGDIRSVTSMVLGYKIVGV